MKLQYIFYVVGIIFLFSTIAYFSYNYLFELPDSIKTVVLLLCVTIFFILGDVMWEKDI